MHADQLTVSPETVRALVDEQFPQWRGLPVTGYLLEAGPRQVLRLDLGCDGLEWERGRAWAFAQAMGLVWYFLETNPAMSRMGRRTLERLLADGGPA